MALDRAALSSELLDRLGPPPVDTDLVRTVRDLVDDWAREADPMPDPDAVLRFQREHLEDAASTTGDFETGLRLTWLQRRVNRTNAATFDAAKRRLSGNGDPGRGRSLLADVESLADEVAALPPSASDAAGPLRAALGDAMLEARYALEGAGAMSPRLAREAPASERGGPPPPDLRPA